ncbi:MAG: gamma-glutamyl-gamma-aminobutyrate hydrolase family protein [Psychrilyobacter sp.]|nr:gamma-glutamyl-gamma-aminobutyrate hydrolase family protein [Psychrilyobacter sp.]
MKNIIIGLSGSQNDFDKTGFIRDYVNNHYSNSMIKIGVTPIILPLTTDKETIAKYIDLVDGIILTGGDDVNPQLFNEEFLPETQVPDLDRDSFDMSLIKVGIEKKIPILGVCRGMQLLNIYFNGSLYQDLKYNDEVKLKHLQDMKKPDMPVHKVILSENSLLNEIFSKNIWVNSFHHQGIKVLGEELKISAVSTDGIIEAIEYTENEQFLLGVQWHPEMMYSEGDNKNMEDLFNFFIKQIKKK